MAEKLCIGIDVGMEDVSFVKELVEGGLYGPGNGYFDEDEGSVKKSYFEKFVESLKREYWKVESDLRYNGGGSAKIADGFVTITVQVDEKKDVSVKIEYDTDMLTEKLFSS